jgi:hypothetical protein
MHQFSVYSNVINQCFLVNENDNENARKRKYTVKPRYLATVGSTRNIGERRGGEVTKTNLKYLGEIRSQ